MPNQHPLDSVADFFGMTDEEREAHYASLSPERAAKKRRFYEQMLELASIDQELGGTFHSVTVEIVGSNPIGVATIQTCDRDRRPCGRCRASHSGAIRPTNAAQRTGKLDA